MPGLDPIIAVDFDGTLCYADYPNIGKPRLEIIEYVKMCREIEKARLILWTSRTGDRLREAVEWCAEQGLTFDAVNENLPEIIEMYGGDNRKITADIYLDDKAMTVSAAAERHKIIKQSKFFQEFMK